MFPPNTVSAALWVCFVWDAHQDSKKRLSGVFLTGFPWPSPRILHNKPYKLI
ncbi:MAG: hypothetical protein ACI80S_000412 [Pseudohongiellaceae bacterium]|jgi:hypothetical protein